MHSDLLEIDSLHLRRRSAPQHRKLPLRHLQLSRHHPRIRIVLVRKIALLRASRRPLRPRQQRTQRLPVIQRGSHSRRHQCRKYLPQLLKRHHRRNRRPLIAGRTLLRVKLQLIRLQRRQIRPQRHHKPLARTPIAQGLYRQIPRLHSRTLQPIPVRAAQAVLRRTPHQLHRNPFLLHRRHHRGLPQRRSSISEVDRRHHGPGATGDHQQTPAPHRQQALSRETPSIRQARLQHCRRQRSPLYPRQLFDALPIRHEALAQNQFDLPRQIILRPCRARSGQHAQHRNKHSRHSRDDPGSRGHPP